MLRTLTISFGAALAAACAPVERDNDVNLAQVEPQVRVLGEGQNCIMQSLIRQTRVRSDQVIDFEMRGGDIYRNKLPGECPGLALEEAFTYDTEINQLCSAEIIYVLQQFGGQLQRGAGCGLGEFVPVEYVEDED